jgi:hypothetical protein
MNSFSVSRIFESSSIGKESLRREGNEEPWPVSSPKKNSHWQVAEKHPSKSVTGPLTISRACQELLLTRRNGTPHSSSLQRTGKYASLLRVSGASYLDIFEQPAKNDFFSKLLGYFNSKNESVIIQRPIPYSPNGPIT